MRNEGGRLAPSVTRVCFLARLVRRTKKKRETARSLLINMIYNLILECDFEIAYLYYTKMHNIVFNKYCILKDQAV